MPQVPTLDLPQVASRPIGTPTSSLHSDPGMYAGLEQAGQRVLGTATSMAQDAWHEEKAQQDSARVMDAYSQLGAWQHENVFDPEKGALTKQGKNAIGIADTTMQAFDDNGRKVMASLANDDQRMTFSKILRQERESVYGTLQRHEGQQLEAVKKQSFDDAVETSISNAGNNFTNPPAIQDAQTLGEHAIEVRATQLGWSEDTKAVALRQYRTKLHGAVLERMAETDGVAAKTYLDAHAGELDGEARVKIDKLVDAASVRDLSRKQAEAVQAYAPDDLGKQLEAVKQVKNTKVYDETVSRLKADWSAKEKAQADQERDMLGRLFQGVDQSGRLDTASKDFVLLSDHGKAVAYEKLRAVQRASRSDDAQARIEQRQTNHEAVAEFESLDLADKVKVDLSTAYPGADTSTAFTLAAKKKKAAAAIASGEADTDAQFRTLVTATSTKMGFVPKSETARDFSAHMQTWLDAWRTDHGGKQPPRDEVHKAIADALLYGDAGLGWLSFDQYKFQAEQNGDKFTAFGAEDQLYAPNKTPAKVRVQMKDGTTGWVPGANLKAWLDAHPGSKAL